MVIEDEEFGFSCIWGPWAGEVPCAVDRGWISRGGYSRLERYLGDDFMVFEFVM